MKLFLALSLLLFLSIGVFIYADIARQPASVIVTQQFDQSTDESTKVVVSYTKQGYEPVSVAIKQGDTITFKNESAKYHWPASDAHPSHNEYPEFDAQGPIAPGETWSFTFNRVGEWHFHNHLQAKEGGIVAVSDPNEIPFDVEEGQIFEAGE